MTGGRSTEDLIRELAARPSPRPFAVDRIGWATGAAALAALTLFWVVLGLRPDLGAALSAPITLSKTVLPLIIAAPALWLALMSSRPGARPAVRVLMVPAGLALLLFVGRLVTVPEGRLLPELMGQTAAACLTLITTLTLVPLSVGMALLRRGAPTRPALSGALLGLASGAGITAGYALHCTEDSPLFFVLWYGLAILIGTGMGAVAGRRFLRW